MRLLNVGTLRLELFLDARTVPVYAILSHRWQEEEILFEDLKEVDPSLAKLEERLQAMQLRLEALEAAGSESAAGFELIPGASFTVTDEYGRAVESGQMARSENGDTAKENEDESRSDPYGLHRKADLLYGRNRKAGWRKILDCCTQARRFGIDYVWIDTCCIDQKSSSELFESINSMMAWYRDAKVCFAYLSDVRRWEVDRFALFPEDFSTSEWFKRGWTLQELIAPREVWFFDCGWRFIGLRSDLDYRISYITGIDRRVLVQNGITKLRTFSVAARLSWASGRKTTRPEDRAYSLLGLFGVNMPTIYGEGAEAAFFRLQVEIFRMEPDHSILAWQSSSVIGSEERLIDLFAPSPDSFRTARFIETATYEKLGLAHHTQLAGPSQSVEAWTYSQYSHGMRIQLLMHYVKKEGSESVYEMCLACRTARDDRFLVIRVVMVQPGHFQRLGSAVERISKAEVGKKTWSLRDAYLSNSTSQIVTTTAGLLTTAETCTVTFELTGAAEKSTLVFVNEKDTFEIKSAVPSLARSAMRDDPSFLIEESNGREDVKWLRFKVGSTGETFVVLLTTIACRLKALIWLEAEVLSADAVRVSLMEGKNDEWCNILGHMLRKNLSRGSVTFMHAVTENPHDTGTARVIVHIGVQGKHGLE